MNQVLMQSTPSRQFYFVEQHADGRFWNTNSGAWEAFDAADWADYAFTFSEYGGTGIYHHAYPIVDPDCLTTEFYYQMDSNGVSPAIGDTPFGSGQSQGVDLFAVTANVLAAALLNAAVGTEEQGTVQTGANTASQIVTDLSGATDGIYNGRVVIFTSGSLVRAARVITGYVASTHTLKFNALPLVPSLDDAFVVV